MDVDLKEYGDSVVIHFGMEKSQINAYTLASSLVSLADSIKSANYDVNPGFDVEVVVEATGPGSFKAKISALYKSAENVFSKGDLKQIAISVLAAYIFQNTLAPESEVNVKVDGDNVIIEKEGDRVIIPREVHEEAEKMGKNNRFTSSIRRTFSTIESDPQIKSFGFQKEMEKEEPEICVPREKFGILSGPQEEEEGVRYIEEHAQLEIVRAILEKSKRRWEFVWQGMRISAPVKDESFYEQFSSHEITIAPGDKLEVDLRIKQERDKNTGIFMNKSYEVVEVFNHIPRQEQFKNNI